MEQDTSKLNLADYPSSWDEFIGQAAAKYQLKVAARSCRKRGVPMGHVLISSSVPGIGKTSLALLTAIELGADIRVQSGPLKQHQLPYLFMDMKDGDVLFLDECHRLVQGGKHNAEWLLQLLQDGTYPTALGDEKAPKITVIAATTDAGKLPQTILDRFEIPPTLTPYTDDEGALIVLEMARKVLVKDALSLPTRLVAEQIASAGNNSPRHIRRILCAVRDLVWADEIAEDDGAYELTAAFAFAGVTEDGLTSQAQKYLQLLFTDYQGNPAGQKVIADRIGEVGAGMTELERTLLDKGLITLTGRGRMLTNDGIRRTRLLLGKDAA